MKKYREQHSLHDGPNDQAPAEQPAEQSETGTASNDQASAGE